MSLTENIRQILNGGFQIARRAAQTYTTVTSAYTLFNVTGAVEIVTLGGLVTSAAVGAETVAMTLNGVAGDAGAVAINGAVGTVVYYGLNVGATTINAAAIPKTVNTLTSMIVGSSVGTVVATFAVGTSWTGEWFAVWRKLSTTGRLAVA